MSISSYFMIIVIFVLQHELQMGAQAYVSKGNLITLLLDTTVATFLL